jgi:hypothetical protein
MPFMNECQGMSSNLVGLSLNSVEIKFENNLYKDNLVIATYSKNQPNSEIFTFKVKDIYDRSEGKAGVFKGLVQEIKIKL